MEKNNIQNSVVEPVRKYEEGLSDIFDNLPIWLRWIIALPASIVAYTVIFFIAYLGWYWYAGDVFTEGFIGQSLRDALIVFVPLYVIHECVPKLKLIISIIFASLYIIMGIAVLTLAFYIRPINMNLDYFFAEMLPGIIVVTVAVIMIIVFVKHKVDLSSRLFKHSS